MQIKNKTNLIFTHKLIKAFADSMVKAFIPLIILKSSQNMFLVMLYLTCYYAFCGVLNLIFKKFLQKYGVLSIILHAVPIIVLQFVLTFPTTWYLCIILALLASFAQILYSVPLNILFTFTDKEVNVAKFQIATNVGKLIFILVSGYILGSTLKNSILLLAIIGSALYILSVLPIMYGYKLIKESFIKISKKPTTVDRKTYKTFNLYHMFFSMFQSVLDVIIPLYLYTNNLTFEAVAIVMALIELCKIGANLLAKFLNKKGLSFLSCAISILCLFTGSIVMLIVKNAIILYICSCIIAISFPLLFVPMFAKFVEKVKKDNNEFDGMTYRDVYIFAIRDIMFLPYFVFPNLIGQFIVGLCSSVCLFVCSKKILIDNKELQNATDNINDTKK